MNPLPVAADVRRRVAPLLTTLLTLALGTASAQASDWPTYRRDYSRSGVSPDALPKSLTEVWSWQSQHPPQPAWQGEAKWDGWNKVYDLKPRQLFDRAFHVVVAANRAYFGSSADDSVRCLRTVEDDNEILVISAKGIMVRQRVSDIPSQGRSATGVMVQKVDTENGDRISSVSIVPKYEETDDA